MSQTKIRSFKEAWTNILIGYSINFTANLLILPLFGFNISVKQNIWLGIIYTGISLARSYCIRRFYNRGDTRTFRSSTKLKKIKME